MNATIVPPRSQIGNILSPTIFQNINSESMQISALPVNVNVITSFLHIHLKDQYFKLSYSRSELIRYRQIIQHAELILVDGSAKHQNLLNLLKKVWMETIIESCFKDFQQEFMKRQENDLKRLKKTVAQRYLFELCKLRQFVQSGRRNFEGKQTEKQVNLSAVFTLSDQNLYHVLQRKNLMFFDKDKTIKIDYPKSLESFQTYKYDLLKSFEAKSLNLDMFLNKDYIFDDIRFLLNQAIKQWENFKSDMNFLFKGKLETNLKVKKQQSEGFNVIGVRRILTKWVEMLLENDKQLASSSRFYNFIMKKPLVYDNFYMNSKDSKAPLIQQKICHLLLQLLICSVYHGNTLNKQFGLFIYDLLRGKMSVQTIQQMQTLVDRLTNPPATGLINKIEVFRMKNRLKTHNRDILINYRYGKVLAAQIQIALDHSGSPEQKKHHKKMYQYKHFIYELSRSIFGPTIELMNIYEDYYRSSEIQMYSIGSVSLRDTKKFQGIKFTDKECFANHKLILIQQQLNTKKQLCRSCFKQLSNYFHCFQCTVSFCQKCVNIIKEHKKILFDKSDNNQLKRIHRLEEVFNLQGFNLVIFHLSYSPASNLMLKYISYLLKLKDFDYNIYVIDVLDDDKTYPYIQKYLKIDRFPAFCLFEDSDLYKCIIGSSLYKIVDLIDLLQTQTPSKTCPEKHELIKKKPASYVFWTCNQCYKTRSKNKQKFNQQIFYCTECLYCCCSQCAFCKNEIEYFEDKNGVSYLSTALVLQKHTECKKGHKMNIHLTNPKEDISFYCHKCTNEFFFIGELGMYSCEICQVYKCNFCSQSGFSNISSQKQYANHAVESYALDIPMCFSCDKPYRFTDHKEDKQWICRNCKNQFNQQYHLSCLKCSKHYCSNCNKKIKSKEQVSVMATQCSCKQGTLKPKTQKLKSLETFMCMICYNRFYYNSPHHQCQSCKFNYCNSCLETLKTKVKVNIQSRDLQNRTITTSYLFQLPLTVSLRHLRQYLNSSDIIPSSCTGRFRLPNRFEIEVEKEQEMLIKNLAPNFEIFYSKTSSLVSNIIDAYFMAYEGNKSISYANKSVIKESNNENDSNQKQRSRNRDKSKDRQKSRENDEDDSSLIEFADSQMDSSFL